MKCFLYSAILYGLLLSSNILSNEIESEPQKAVLITGASSGFGRATAELLAANGYFVYAGARKDEDLTALNKIENIMAVRLDVTNNEHISSAVKTIQGEGRGLWGLVNNAGVFMISPLIEAKEEDLKFLFDVNVYGVFRVTKAFAPMILESKGRIINISSISGVLSVGTAGIYAASKHALEALTDSLAEELQPFGVHVAAVNPGNFDTALGAKHCARILNESDDWGIFEDWRKYNIDSCKKTSTEDPTNKRSPIIVAKVIEQALFEANPRGRYLVATQGGAGETIAWGLREMLALNIGHEQSYTRDELVQFIDLMWPYMDGTQKWETPEDEWEFHTQWAERKLDK